MGYVHGLQLLHIRKYSQGSRRVLTVIGQLSHYSVLASYVLRADRYVLLRERQVFYDLLSVHSTV
jgi:hypothetical protein